MNRKNSIDNSKIRLIKDGILVNLICMRQSEGFLRPLDQQHWKRRICNASICCIWKTKRQLYS